MRKFLLILALVLPMFADLSARFPTPEYVASGIKIVDIRTAPEWEQTGIVKDAITITFFDAVGNYDAAAFLAELDKHIAKGETFALICRTGNRTTVITDFLQKQGYKAINLKGGIRHLIDKEGYTPTPYGK